MKTAVYIVLAIVGIALLTRSSTLSQAAWSPWSNWGMPVPGSTSLFRPIVFTPSTNSNDPFLSGGFTDPGVVAGTPPFVSQFQPAAAADLYSPLYGG